MKKLFTQKLLAVVVLFTIMISAKAQDITALYMVGDAVPAGWNIAAATPMVQSATNANTFSWHGVLKAGELKIATFAGDWCDGQWLNAETNGQSITAATYIVTNGCDGPDNKWRVSDTEAGIYIITVNLQNETIVFDLQSTEVSDATLSALTLSAGTLTPEFSSTTKSYTVTLPEGTASVDVTATATDMAATVTGAGVVDLSNGDVTVSVVVLGTDGFATETYTINFIIEMDGELYSSLNLVGDATPAGWNIGTPEPMIQDSENPNLFTWEGALKAGEFKISTFSGGWCDGDWLLALAPNMPINEGEYAYSVYSGCAPNELDYKWRVQPGEEGDYKITVDVENGSIAIEFTGSTSGISQLDASEKLSVYPNPAQNSITVSQKEAIQQIQIVTLSGKEVLNFNTNSSRVSLNVSGLNRGVYLVKAVSKNKVSAVHKLVISR